MSIVVLQDVHQPFIWKMLYEALFFVNPAGKPTFEAVLQPPLEKYGKNFGKTSDLSLGLEVDGQLRGAA